MNKDFFKLPEKVFGVNISFLKLFIVPVLVLLGFIVSLNLIILPKFSGLSTLNDSINEVNSQIKLTDQKINYLSSVDQEQIQSDANYLNSAVLQEKNSYVLIGVIRSVADRYGFNITTFSISSLELKGDEKTLKVADKDVAARLPLSLTLVGPDDRRVEMLTALENTLPILFINTLEISNSNGISTLDMIVSSYYVAEKTDLVSGNLSLEDLIPTQEENDLLQTISGFTRMDDSILTIGETSDFVEYQRENPFSL